MTQAQDSTPTPPPLANDEFTLPDTALIAMAQSLNLSMERAEQVCENWHLLAAIAQPLMEFSLPPEAEPAPCFDPE